MSKKATSDDDATTQEHYEFAPVPSAGRFNVANLEYGEEEAKDHTYTVTMIAGEAARCTCPADKYHSGKCKHRVAVEARDDFEREGNCSHCGDTGMTESGVLCCCCIEYGGPAA